VRNECYVPVEGSRYVAVVDPEDYPRVMEYQWFAPETKKGGSDVAPAAHDIDGKLIRLHRLVMRQPRGTCEAKNGNYFDCRKENLSRMSSRRRAESDE
jgi:hypothetical protein